MAQTFSKLSLNHTTREGIPRGSTGSPEPHPYSIACGYNPAHQIKLGIKTAGDHTCTLGMLEVGDALTLYGPYGHFSDRFLSGERDCVFVGGGIGITPFLGMWHVALHSDDRQDTQEVPDRLRRLHPELIKTWKSPLVYLFYICRNQEEASFDDDIRHEVSMSHFHEFRGFEERGHRYELYLTSTQGRFTADYVDQRVKGGVRDKNIFLCGPVYMESCTKNGIPQRGRSGPEDTCTDPEKYSIIIRSDDGSA